MRPYCCSKLCKFVRPLFYVCLIAMIIIVFVWNQKTFNASVPSKKEISLMSRFVEQIHEEITTPEVLALLPQHLHKFLLPRTTMNFFFQKFWSILDVRRSIEKQNAQQIVYNKNKFDELKNDSLIIVIQVHTRLLHLRHLIVSLAQAKGIEDTLVIFSHDYFDIEMNELIKSIDFCKVMQIFYPFSIQTHPNEFPGNAPNDCFNEFNMENTTLKTDCIKKSKNVTQTKHHWWWKANRVFDQLIITRNHTGLVLFLEEDFIMADDFIHVIKLMQKTAQASCPQCNIYSPGIHVDKIYHEVDANGVYKFFDGELHWYDKNTAEVSILIRAKHILGLAFNRSVWHEIFKRQNIFCTYNNYNWDRTLDFISESYMSNKLNTVVIRGPRLFHTGSCIGMHHNNTKCNDMNIFLNIYTILNYSRQYQFPNNLTFTYPRNIRRYLLSRRGYTGWEDVRDHQLCMNLSVPDYKLEE